VRQLKTTVEKYREEKSVAEEKRQQATQELLKMPAKPGWQQWQITLTTNQPT
jgi:hypothetical protein